jgi:hypothetical protein
MLKSGPEPTNCCPLEAEHPEQSVERSYARDIRAKAPPDRVPGKQGKYREFEGFTTCRFTSKTLRDSNTWNVFSQSTPLKRCAGGEDVKKICFAVKIAAEVPSLLQYPIRIFDILL